MDKWGLFDAKENIWLGTKEGPLLYDNEELGQIAARIVDVQLKQPAGRTRSVLYNHTGTHLRDEVELKLSAEEALRRLEAGETL